MVTPVNSVPPQPTPPPPLTTRGDVAVAIISTTLDPAALQPPATITGNVTAVARDGTVTVHTDAGDILVQPDARVTIRTGQTIAVDIAANGNATIRTANTAPTPTPGSGVNVPTTPPTDAPDLAQTLRDLALQNAATPPTQNLPPQIGTTLQMRAISMAAASALMTPTTASPLTTLPLFESLPVGNIPGAALSPSIMTKALFTALESLHTPTFGAPGDASNTPLNPQTRLTLNARDDLDAFLTRTINTGGTARSGLTGTPPDFTMTRTAPGGVFMFAGPAGKSVMPMQIMIPGGLSRAFETNFMIMGSTNRGAMIMADVSDMTRTPSFITTQNTGASLPPGTMMTGIPNGVVAPGSLGATPQFLTAALIQDLLAALPMSVAQTLFGPSARPPIPSTASPTQMATAATLFIAAVRSGDLSGILDDRAMDVLRRMGKSDTLDALNDAVGALKSRSSDNPAQPGEWRSFMIPLHFQGPVMPVMLHMKSAGTYDPDNQDAQQGQGGQRFVLDLNFDRMGMVQLDMLYQPGKLDSVLRTELPLSMAMRGMLEVKYAGAMNKVSHTGELHFQDGLKHWIMVDQGQEQVRVTA